MIKRYKIIKKEMDTAMNDNIQDNKQKSRTAGKLKFIFTIVVLLIIITVLLVWRYNIRLEEKYYDSLQELAENYYPDENVVSLNEGNYYYVIADSEQYKGERFVYKTPEGKYIYLQELLIERFKRKQFHMFKDIEEQNFHSFVQVEIHEGNCIILLERYSIKDEKVNIKVYDNFDQLEPTAIYSREYYITMIDNDSITEDYEIRVEIGEDSYYIIGAKEIGRAK